MDKIIGILGFLGLLTIVGLILVTGVLKATCGSTTCQDESAVFSEVTEGEMVDWVEDVVDMFGDIYTIGTVILESNTSSNPSNITYQFDLAQIEGEVHRTANDGNRSRMRECPFVNNIVCPQVVLIPQNAQVLVNGYVLDGGVWSGNEVWFRVNYGGAIGYIHSLRLQPANTQHSQQVAIEPTIIVPTSPPIPTEIVEQNLPYQLIQSHDELISYSEGWVVQQHDIADDGYFLLNTSDTDQISFTFNGTHIEIVYIAGQSFGDFAIFIDDIDYGIVSTSSGRQLIPNQTSSVNNLSEGEHTLTLIPQNSVVAIDSFIVYP